MSFSERMGFVPVRTALQLDSMAEELRNGLWNALYQNYWADDRKRFKQRNDSAEGGVALAVWTQVIKQPADTLRSQLNDSVKNIREYFFNGEWNLVYDIVEFVAQYQDPNLYRANEYFVNTCNSVLTREGSGYRFLNRVLCPVTAAHEIESIEAALKAGDRFGPAAEHIQTAVNRLANREAPDYRNCIKESISAVEAACRIVSGDDKATLGAAIKKLRDNNVDLHPAFEAALSKMYGYTNDADGIRHALLAESVLDGSDARFMLVICSAFVNYLRAKTQ